MGHSEPASGMCSLAKVLITFENRLIPASLHFTEPNPSIEALVSGDIKPVVENTPFIDSIVAINSFGFGGVNVNVLLRAHQKDVTEESFDIVADIPRLIPVFGRTEQSVHFLLDFLERNPKRLTRDLLSLLNDISLNTESEINYRGYLLIKRPLHPQNAHHVSRVLFSRDVSRVGHRRQLWFVFSGKSNNFAIVLYNIQ